MFSIHCVHFISSCLSLFTHSSSANNEHSKKVEADDQLIHVTEVSEDSNKYLSEKQPNSEKNATVTEESSDAGTGCVKEEAL